MITVAKRLICVLAVGLIILVYDRGVEMIPRIADTLTESLVESDIDADIVKDGASEYSICISDGGDTVKAAAEELSAAIYQRTGANIPVVSEDADLAIYLCTEGDFDVGEYGYAVTVINGDVYVYGACEDSLMCALAVFDNEFVGAADGELVIPGDTHIAARFDDKPILADYIDLGLDINAEISPKARFGVYTLDGVHYGTSQGSATDGEYIYVALLKDDFEGVIVKMDFTGNFVAATEPQEFGHANDMTYDTDKGLVVVVHGTSSVNTENGNGNGRRFSLIDPETMEVVYTNPEGFELTKEAGAISYNTETGVYTIGRLCTYFHQFKMNDDYTLDYSFSTLRGSAEEEGRAGYVGQGLGGDNRYVYFPYSHGKTDNLLVVYNNDGQYVTTISYPCSMESESLFFTDGRYYINYNHGGSQVYELVYSPVYRAAVEADA